MNVSSRFFISMFDLFLGWMLPTSRRVKPSYIEMMYTEAVRIQTVFTDTFMFFMI